MSFPVSETGDINPSGSKIDANSFNIPLFYCSFTGISGSTQNVSFDLSQRIYNILQSVARVPFLHMKVQINDFLVFLPVPWHLNATYVILYMILQRFFLMFFFIFLTFSAVTSPVTMSSI